MLLTIDVLFVVKVVFNYVLFIEYTYILSNLFYLFVIIRNNVTIEITIGDVKLETCHVFN